MIIYAYLIALYNFKILCPLYSNAISTENCFAANLKLLKFQASLKSKKYKIQYTGNDVNKNIINFMEICVIYNLKLKIYVTRISTKLLIDNFTSDCISLLVATQKNFFKNFKKERLSQHHFGFSRTSCIFLRDLISSLDNTLTIPC